MDWSQPIFLFVLLPKFLLCSDITFCKGYYSLIVYHLLKVTLQAITLYKYLEMLVSIV